ncbi:MAG: NAD(P)/FAD-dependent oxidoreductase [Steroidobacteraceae bacterium]|jgi:cyclohexanone monooxygenase|nr:NAD(P)/FAD-dependent oxidoreductase [Steroidobacteraceae bacterium]
MNDSNAAVRELDAVVVGAGFSGMYMLHKLRGLGLKVRVIEAGENVGGTWYWNRYPGARCDVMSMEYCYSFDPQLEQEWEWTERYPSQPEILRYLDHVADRLDLRRDITFRTRVTSAHYDEGANRWTVTTDAGETFSARFCVMATGCLSTTRKPPFEGVDAFRGRTFHTGEWPHEPVDFTGRRVGVIGTGSSGIQVVPVVAQQAAKLHVFQRTPNFSIPAHNGPLDPDFVKQFKSRYPAHRAEARVSLFGVPWAIDMNSALGVPPEERQRKYEAAWAQGGATPMLVAYVDLLANEQANETAAEFVRQKIREIVKDPKTAELLTPRDHPLGTKRICVDTDYYATFNRPNVELVDVRSAPIVRFTATGLETAAAAYELDDVIFATGYDAMTGTLLRIDVRGRGGVSLRDKWADGPKTYLGLSVAGFPNLFTITGPGSPSVLSNVVVSIEQHVEWTADCIAWLRQEGYATIEATPEAEEKWVAHVNEVADTTLFPKANSWYTGANIPGKPRVFMPYVGGVGPYREICDGVAKKGYEGFRVGA